MQMALNMSYYANGTEYESGSRLSHATPDSFRRKPHQLWLILYRDSPFESLPVFKNPQLTLQSRNKDLSFSKGDSMRYSNVEA